MSWDPFRVLGVDECVDERSLRAAFRRLVHELHPDRRMDDPRATDRLREVVAAYEAARSQLRGNPYWERPSPRPEEPPPAPRDRLRYACGCCDDTYAYDGECPHCEVALFDSWDESAPASPRAEDPRVASFITELETRGEPRESVFDAHAPMVAMVGLGIAGALAVGIYAPVGTMFLAYAMVLGGVHLTALRQRAPF
jgi:hypothetical protein